MYIVSSETCGRHTDHKWVPWIREFRSKLKADKYAKVLCDPRQPFGGTLYRNVVVTKR